MDSIEWLLKIPSENQYRPYIIESTSGIQHTFGEIHQDACAIGSEFLSEGFQKGNRIAFLLNNSVDYIKLYFGCLYTGLVVVPINPVLSSVEIEYVLNHSQARALVISQETANKIDFKLINSNLKIINIIDESHSEFLPEKGILWNLKKIQRSSNFNPFYEVNGEDELIVVYTSGTTAKPKGVVHKIANLIENERVFGGQIGINKKNRFYNCYPMSSLLGYHNLLLLPYVNESSVVLTEAFNAGSIINFWDNVKRYHVDTLWLVPTVISMLLEIDRENKGIDYCKNNNCLVLTGTAPLPLKTRKKFEKKYGVKVFENYGLSETLFITTNRPSCPIVSGSTGLPLPKVEIKIIDSQGKEKKFRDEGEILIKTPHLMKGYFKEDEDTSTENEWFKTGDVGYITEKSQLFITGRNKDLIIRGGFNISPASIEEVIYQHSSVLECAVIGIPDKFSGEKIIGVIRMDSSESFDSIQEELSHLCNDHLPKFKQPAKFIELEEFPKTFNGKIQKNKIRDWLKGVIDKKGDTLEKLIQKVDTEQKISNYFRSSKVVSEIKEALSIRYNCDVYEMKQNGVDVTTLSLGEAYFEIPLYSFDELPFPDLYHYSHSRGSIDLRTKLSRYFKNQYEVSFDPEKEIIITAGSKAAIYMALLSVINPGDEVIVYEPAWVSYPEQIKLCYGSPVLVPYYEDVFDFEKYITNCTKVIIINNPNNPTGRVFNVEELSHLYHLARKFNLFILSDEAYSDFVSGKQKFISAGNFDPELNHSIIVNSISKNFGISGWRIGYVITNSSLTDQILKINQNLITCPPTILVNYVSRYYDDIIEFTLPQITELLKKRQYFSIYLKKLGLRALSGTATFYFFVSIEPSSLTSIEFCDRLLTENHVCAVPGIGYGQSCDKFIRVSIGTESNERIEDGLQMIKKIIEESTI